MASWRISGESNQYSRRSGAIWVSTMCRYQSSEGSIGVVGDEVAVADLEAAAEFAVVADDLVEHAAIRSQMRRGRAGSAPFDVR